MNYLFRKKQIASQKNKLKIDIGSWIKNALQLLLITAAIDAPTSPSNDLQVLVSHILGRSRSWILAHPEFILSVENQKVLDNNLQRLINGEPLPYIIGHWEFFGMDFLITPDVLIPRPETELLVEEAIKWSKQHPQCKQAVDIGTGSGCISVSIAQNNNNLFFIASDFSLTALKVAKYNINKHHLSDRIHLINCDLASAINGTIHMACANLPYIPSMNLDFLQVSKYEPHIALDGGEDGFDLISRIIIDAQTWLAPDGLLLLEIETEQGIIAKNMALDAFPRASINVLPDLAGHSRLLFIENHAK